TQIISQQPLAIVSAIPGLVTNVAENCGNLSLPQTGGLVSCVVAPGPGAGTYATVLRQTDSAGNGPATNSKGRVNFGPRAGGLTQQLHLITLVDSAPAKTTATGGNRPLSDANDTYFGEDDNGSGGAAGSGLSVGAPASISGYIGNVGDGVNWKERLTST